MEEKKAHNLIRHLLQKIWDEHRLCITDIGIDWFKVDANLRSQFYISELKIQSKTEY